MVTIGCSSDVHAQQTLPPGGDDFKTAVPLSLGEFQGGTLADGKKWYYLVSSEIKPGQELQIKDFFSGNTLMSVIVYDQNKQSLAKNDYQKQNETHTGFWLNGSGQSEKCYLELSNQSIWSATFQNVSLEIIDRFDADSQTDAGGSFDSALPIEINQYKSFLDFNYKASDNKDFYKIDVPRGQKLTVKVTPPDGLFLDLKIYDKNRSQLVNEYSENEGATVVGSIQALTADTFYIAISPKYSSDQNQVSQYSLDISNTDPNTQKTGVANTTDTDDTDILLSQNSFLIGIGQNIKFILLVVATVLIIIVVTVILLLGKSKKKVPKEKTPVKVEEAKEEEKETAKVEIPEFIYCSKCGTKNSADAKFCSKCGERLKGIGLL